MFRRKREIFFVLSVVLRLQRVRSDLKDVFLCPFIQYIRWGPTYVLGIALDTVDRNKAIFYSH